MAANIAAHPALSTSMTKEERKVIFASSLGTVFEWYDFYLYGSLAPIIAKQFFSGLNETSGFLFALLAFSAGFAVRPFGAIVFGRIGDLVGRKYTFLITILHHGHVDLHRSGCCPPMAGRASSASTCPESAGWRPVILHLASACVQGLALGGEYGGAATYVAEHTTGRTGAAYMTSWIQTTATVGSLYVAARDPGLQRSQIDRPRAIRRLGLAHPVRLISIILLAVLGLYIRLSAERVVRCSNKMKVRRQRCRNLL